MPETRPPSGAEQVAPRAISHSPVGADAVFVHGARIVGASVLVITGGVAIFLGLRFVPTIQTYGLSFFTETDWAPERDILGIAGVLVGTFTIAIVAMSIAFPLSITVALYIAEYSPAWLRPTLVSLLDLMAAIPSIVYGLWGFFLVMPHAADFAHFLHLHLGGLPFFQVEGVDPHAPVPYMIRYTASAFCAGIAVAMMVLPMAAAVMREVFSQTPPGEKEAALALGATKWGVIRSVVLPFGRGGIIGGSMLGLGRALGETIAVLLIISPEFVLKFRPLEIGGNSVSALIAGRFGDASPTQLSALLAAGFVLFMITLGINTVASIIVNRSRSGVDADA